MLPSQQHLFPGCLWLFQQDNARPCSARLITAWLHRHDVFVLDWPACCSDLCPIENVWHIIMARFQTTTTRLLSSWNLEFSNNGHRFLLNSNKLHPQVPKWFKSVIKRKSDATQWKNMPWSHYFFNGSCRHQIKDFFYRLNTISFLEMGFVRNMKVTPATEKKATMWDGSDTNKIMNIESFESLA